MSFHCLIAWCLVIGSVRTWDVKQALHSPWLQPRMVHDEVCVKIRPRTSNEQGLGDGLENWIAALHTQLHLATAPSAEKKTTIIMASPISASRAYALASLSS